MGTTTNGSQTTIDPEDPKLDHLWQRKRLTPQQLLVHDVRLEHWRSHSEPRLEVRERVTSELVPHPSVVTPSSKLLRASEAARNPVEQQILTDLEEEFGWMSSLRIPKVQEKVDDPEYTAKIRWMYVPDFLASIHNSLTSPGRPIYLQCLRSLPLIDQCRPNPMGIYMWKTCHITL